MYNLLNLENGSYYVRLNVASITDTVLFNFKKDELPTAMPYDQLVQRGNVNKIEEVKRFNDALTTRAEDMAAMRYNILGYDKDHDTYYLMGGYRMQKDAFDGARELFAFEQTRCDTERSHTVDLDWLDIMIHTERGWERVAVVSSEGVQLCDAEGKPMSRKNKTETAERE